MWIHCRPCNRAHNLNAKETRWALMAFQDGDAQEVTSNGVLPKCLTEVSDIGYETEVSEYVGSAI